MIMLIFFIHLTNFCICLTIVAREPTVMRWSLAGRWKATARYVWIVRIFSMRAKSVSYGHPVFCGVTRARAPRRADLCMYVNERTRRRSQWTEHYSALQEETRRAWCIDRGWPHVIEWVTSRGFYCTKATSQSDASAKTSSKILIFKACFFLPVIFYAARRTA